MTVNGFSDYGYRGQGTASDTSNRLNGILILTQLLLEESDKSGPQYDDLKKIEAEVLDCRSLMKALSSLPDNKSKSS